ncbi:unnamed protein product [Lepeophtheirus salmonis]|uniref:(salmon louse) hypothetical protein n=1 Tax=Lepeophtheirus salmonis TaxID=72036 RepID=A0A7R8D1U6_LEPSM|nr:unnamed protein product [Lepeophtheirus salmonis]CAF2998004.1 unnamed protein product [Lepeophtheirus salmonis]
MSEIKDATASLPRELTEDPILSYDPLPPTDSIDAYVRNAKTSQNEDSSTFQAFFRSLFLPSYNIRDQQTNEAPAGAEGGAEGERGALQTHVPNDADASADSEGGDVGSWD